MQTNSHMGLVMYLAEHNGSVVEALNIGASEGANFEAAQTAKRILMEKGSKVEKRGGQRSVIHPSVSQKQWRRENGLDVSLEDGIVSSGMCTLKSVIENREHNRFSEESRRLCR
ncbi:hypothetical protein Tco_0739471 [Tanacetum coccineum]